MLVVMKQHKTDARTPTSDHLSNHHGVTCSSPEPTPSSPQVCATQAPTMNFRKESKRFFKESSHHLDDLTGFCFCFAARIIRPADHGAYSRQSAASQFCQPSASPPVWESHDEMS